MYRVILYVIAALLSIGIATASAAADDQETCKRTWGLDDSIAACSRLIDRNPADGDAYFNRAHAYDNKSDYDRAIADYDRLIQLNPRHVEAYRNRGQIYILHKQDYDRAIADFDQVLKLSPNDGDAYKQRGSAYELRARSHDNDAPGDRDAASKDLDRAIVDFGQAIRLDPNDADAHLQRAFIYHNKGDYDGAIFDYDQLIQVETDKTNLYHFRGMAYAEKGDFDRAIADFGQVIKLSPDEADIYGERGEAYMGKGDFDGAIGDFDRWIKLVPNAANPYHKRGKAYAGKGDYERAITDFSQAIRLDPDAAAEAYSDRGLAYAKMGDFDRATADLDKALALDPDDTESAVIVHGHRAAVYDLRGDFDRAVAEADHAIQLDAKSGFAYNWRGNAWFGKGEYARAIADYDQALKLDFTLFDARQNRQRARAALASPQSAVKPVAAVQPPAPTAPAALPQPAFRPIPAEHRVALVIGNSQYRTVASLPNPRRDASAVADALQQAGFQTIELAIDLDRDATMNALRAFRDQADNADWALVYFAGHGIEINRVNYLVPVDAKLLDDRDVKAETVSYEDIAAAIGGARALRLVVLDACRVNPFKERMRRAASAVRSPTDRGLAPPPEPEPGMMIAYSAKEGEVAADDVGGDHSPFARAFVARLKMPGLEVRRLFDLVRDDVLAATDRRQQPFTYQSLPGAREFFFVTAK
jgi:tetratricopeptide (TPR) repeat protein